MNYNDENSINDSNSINFNPNEQSNISENQKNIEFVKFVGNVSNFAEEEEENEEEKNEEEENEEENEEEEQNLNKIKCNENSKETKLKIFYRFYKCYVSYECKNHFGIAKFNDYFNEKKDLFNKNYDLNINDEKLKIKYEEFVKIEKDSFEFLKQFKKYKNKLKQLINNKISYYNKMNDVLDLYYKNITSLIKNQIKLCKYQFYNFQNLINNKEFKQEEFENLNLFNFKNICFDFTPIDEKTKNPNKNHVFNKFKYFCSRESNSILRENLLFDNKKIYQPNEYEKKIYEIFLNFDELKNEKIKFDNKKFKFLIYYKIDNFGYLNFPKEKIYFKCDHDKNKNSFFLDFYNNNNNIKNSIKGKWMKNFNNLKESCFDVFFCSKFFVGKRKKKNERLNFFIGKWKKLNFDNKIIHFYFGNRIECELKKINDFTFNEFGYVENKNFIDIVNNDFKNDDLKFKKKIINFFIMSKNF